jgi:hypothetical protein
MYGWSPLPRNLGAALRDAQSTKARVRLSAVADLVRWTSGEDREQCIAALVRLLGSDPDLDVQAAAALGLADAEAVESLPALIAAAQTGAPRLCQMSLLALGELAAPEHAGALDVVRTALGSGAPALRFQSLVAAHRLFEDDELQPLLARALGDAEAKVRYIACRIVEERYFSDARAAAAGLAAAQPPASAPLPAAGAPLLDAFTARLWTPTRASRSRRQSRSRERGQSPPVPCWWQRSIEPLGAPNWRTSRRPSSCARSSV